MFKKLKKQTAEAPDRHEVLSLDPAGATGPAPRPDTAEVATPRALVAGRATYHIEDFAALGEAEVTALVARAESDRASGLDACAHLVVTRDLTTGAVSHHVPCGSGLEAFALAAQVVAEKRAQKQQLGESAPRFTVLVTPLLPH